MLHAPGVLAVPCLATALITGEQALILPFALTILVSIGVGQAGYHARLRKGNDAPGSARLAGLAVAWLLASAIATLPFLWAGEAAITAEAARAYGTPMTAFFEAMSGLTTTGLTMSADPSALPYTLQLWRSMLQWGGGVGIVLLAALVLHPGVALKPLYVSEVSLEAPEGLSPHRIAVRLLSIYAGLTLASALALAAAGMPAWEALNHGITGLATGGFSVKPDSFIGYSAPIKVVAVFVMLVGATSFAVHYRLLVARDPRALKSRQLYVFIALVTAGAIVIAALNELYTGEPAFADALFDSMSALGTVGFSGAAVSDWHPTYVPLLLVAMIIGAQMGSTGGGIKLERVIQIVLGIVRGFRKEHIIKPDTLTEDSVTTGSGDTTDSDDDPKEGLAVTSRADRNALRLFWQASVVAWLYLVTLALGTFALLLCVGEAEPFLDVFFEATSALGTVGYSTGLTSPDLGPAGLAVLIGLMWAGRLELLALIVLLLLLVFHAGQLTFPATPAPSLAPTGSDGSGSVDADADEDGSILRRARLARGGE